MNTKQIGMAAIAIALGSTANANSIDSIIETNWKISSLNETKDLVNQLETSSDKIEYDKKIQKIRELLEGITNEEIQELKYASPRCAESG